MMESLSDYLVENRGRLIPLVLLLMITMALSMIVATKVFPAWRTYQDVTAQLDASQQELAARDTQGSGDNITILQSQVEHAQSGLTEAAAGFLTDSQAEALLSRLYSYAAESHVEITALQLLPQQSSAAQTTATPVYNTRSFKLAVSGESSQLLDFVTRLQEATIPAVAISGLEMNTGASGAILNMNLNIYASSYADGTVLDGLVAIDPAPVVAAPSATPVPQTDSPASDPASSPTPVSLVVTPDSPAPDATQSAAQSDNTMLLLRSERADLERLAATRFGENRPPGWSGSTDTTDPQYAVLIRLDLELLAGTVLGENQRPDGWIGAVPGTLLSIAQDSRHDLELLADAMLNGQRPVDWSGANPLLKCSRSTTTLIQFLQANTDFAFNIDPAGADFCAAAETAASEYAYTHSIDTANVSSDAQTIYYIINSPFAVAFNNRTASRRLGVIPENTQIVPIARSYATFSNMMLVRGDHFEVFVDYHFTSVSDAEFYILPDINTVEPAVACSAYWCVGG